LFHQFRASGIYSPTIREENRLRVLRTKCGKLKEKKKQYGKKSLHNEELELMICIFHRILVRRLNLGGGGEMGRVFSTDGRDEKRYEIFNRKTEGEEAIWEA
jgi:hypothetical protein